MGKGIRNRIVGEAMVDPATLEKHPDNWRTHPQAQRDVMREALDALGWLQRVVVNRRTGRILDGHMRVAHALEVGEQVPVVYVDVPESEEATVLATFDPVASMAGIDKRALARVLASVDVDSVALQKLIAELEVKVGVSGNGAGTEVLLDQAVQLEPGKELVVIVCDDDEQFVRVREVLGLKRVRRGGYKPGTEHDDSNIERVVPFRKFIGAFEGAPTIEAARDAVVVARKKSAKKAAKKATKKRGR